MKRIVTFLRPKWRIIALVAALIALVGLLWMYRGSFKLPRDKTWLDLPWQAIAGIVAGVVAYYTFWVNKKQKDEHAEQESLDARFSDTFERLGSENPSVRSAATVRVAEMALMMPLRSQGQQGINRRPFFRSAVSQLLSTIRFESNPAVRDQALTSIALLFKGLNDEEAVYVTQSAIRQNESTVSALVKGTQMLAFTAEQKKWVLDNVKSTAKLTVVREKEWIFEKLSARLAAVEVSEDAPPLTDDQIKELKKSFLETLDSFISSILLWQSLATIFYPPSRYVLWSSDTVENPLPFREPLEHTTKLEFRNCILGAITLPHLDSTSLVLHSSSIQSIWASANTLSFHSFGSTIQNLNFWGSYINSFSIINDPIHEVSLNGCTINANKLHLWNNLKVEELHWADGIVKGSIGNAHYVKMFSDFRKKFPATNNWSPSTKQWMKAADALDARNQAVKG